MNRTIDLPLGRALTLNIERQGNRFLRAKAVDYWLAGTMQCVRAAGWVAFVPPVSATFHAVYKDGRSHADPDGIISSAKAALDALVALELLPGDGAQHVPWRHYGPPYVLGWEGLTMTIKEMGG